MADEINFAAELAKKRKRSVKRCLQCGNEFEGLSVQKFCKLTCKNKYHYYNLGLKQK